MEMCWCFTLSNLNWIFFIDRFDSGIVWCIIITMTFFYNLIEHSVSECIQCTYIIVQKFTIDNLWLLCEISFNLKFSYFLKYSLILALFCYGIFLRVKKYMRWKILITHFIYWLAEKHSFFSVVCYTYVTTYWRDDERNEIENNLSVT